MPRSTTHSMRYDPLTDEELVRACLQGQRRAQRALYDRHVQAMYNTVIRYTYNRHDTEDILQQAFSKVFRYLHTYKSTSGTLRTWIRTICVRATLNHFQRRKLQFKPLTDAPVLHAKQTLPLEQLETDYIIKLIEQLPTHYRIIFNLYEIEGYSHKEIAKMTQMNVSSSRVYLTRAKQMLRRSITAFKSTPKDASL